MRLRYWFRTGFQTLLVTLGASAVYYVIMTLQLSDSWTDGLTTLSVYLLLFGSIMQLALSFGLYKLNVSLALSFGSTRNEVLLGLQVHRLVPVAGVTACLLLLTALAPEEAFLPLSSLLPLSLGLFLGASALGSLLGIVNAKWGKLAIILTVVVVVLLSFLAGFLAAFAIPDRWLDALGSISALCRAALGVGLIVYGLVMIPEHRTVWRYNVKL